MYVRVSHCVKVITITKHVVQLTYVGHDNDFQHWQTNADPVLVVHNLKLIQETLGLFSSTKIRPQAKIDNFAFKNSNIIIEGLF